MTERSRRAFLKSAAAGGVLTGGAVLLPAGLARAAAPAAPAAAQPVPQPRAATYRLRVTNNSNAFVEPDTGA